MTLVIILVLILMSAGYIVLIYNRLIAQIETIRNNQKQIDIQLDRRFKVFESLINVVRKYMDYEKTTLKEVVALRNQAQAAKAKGDEEARIAAENKISEIAYNINLVFEQYPNLRASENARQLQEEIVSTENKLAYAKQSYNDSVEIYNAYKKSFPTTIVVSAFHSRLDFDFPYWQLPDQKIAEHESYTVQL